jgi:glycosyltransferase involved in cell wall biosynthesis
MFRSFDVSILISGLPITASTLGSHSLGGSESAGIYMARALSVAGAQVTVFCNTANPWKDETGVQFLSAEEWTAYTKTVPHDVCIVQRTPDVFGQKTNARLNVLWCHDLALGRHQRAFRGALWNVDLVVVLSLFMAAQYRQIYGISDDMLLNSRNGVDLALLRALQREGIARDRNKLMFCARPERGLDVLLGRVMPQLLSRRRDLRLYLAGYDNLVPEWEDFYAECRRLAARLGDRVVQLGSLAKADLYRHYLSARAYVYPTPSPALANFREVSCITAMECQAAGLPIVTSALGALPETVAVAAGVLVDGDPSQSDSAAYVDQFVDGVMRLIEDDGVWTFASEAGVSRGAELDWSAVAHDWLAAFERAIRKRNESPTRLLSHCRRVSDRVAAERLQGEGDSQRATTPSAASASSALDSVAEPEEGSLAESVERWIVGEKIDAPSVLDYGASHAACYSRLAGCGWVNLECIDQIDAAARATDRFDCALVRGVLQQVAEPWAILERIEKRVRSGGKVWITVPFGAETGRAGCPRLWCFDAHDLRDMISAKPDLSIEPLYAGDDPVTGEPCGSWLAAYTADQRPIPRIDLERHLWLQRPRQTLSAAIIAGPGSEETLHWMVRSIMHLVDEIIVADCGMSGEAHRIARQYDIRLVAGVDPMKHGFDAARNAALDQCTGDWCLWIDTDEKLVGGQALHRYLRENAYHAYGLQQHNFACDLLTPPDLPNRLFRRRAYQGRVPRFFGAIHEQPELALNEGLGPVIALRDVHIAHVGYLEEETRRGRFARNWPLLALDQSRYPDRLLQKYFLMRENTHLVRYTLAASGGRLDARMRARCRETIDLYRKYFLGKRPYLAREALTYYSEALTVLGEGFEAAFQVEADRAQATPNGVRRYRFASMEDFQAELQRVATEKAGHLLSKSW